MRTLSLLNFYVLPYRPEVGEAANFCVSPYKAREPVPPIPVNSFRRHPSGRPYPVKPIIRYIQPCPVRNP
jgi:hypothetical protein